MVAVALDHLVEHRRTLVHDVVAQHDHERLLPHVLAGHRHGVAQAPGFALADVVDVGQFGDGLHLLEQVLFAAAGQLVLEFEAAVEMVFQAALAPAGDDEDVGDADPHCLLDHVLDGRFVDQREHLFGLGLGGGQEAGAQAGGGDDGFTNRSMHRCRFYRSPGESLPLALELFDC